MMSSQYLTRRLSLILFCLVFVFGCRRSDTKPMPTSSPTPKNNVLQDVSSVRYVCELESQQAVEIQGDCTAHFGIDKKETQQGSGVLVYCLLQNGAMADMHFHIKSGIPLGPFSLRWVGEDRSADAKVNNKSEIPMQQRNLFIAIVPVCFEGTRELGIYFENKRIVAKVRITGNKPNAQAWYPLFSKKWQMPNGVPEVLPAFNGNEPTLPKNLTDGKLPTLIPSQESKLDLSIKWDSLRISSVPGLTTRPDRHFLIRFWVNDRPVLWSNHRGQLGDSGIEGPTKEVFGSMNWRNFIPNLKKGDRLTIQLLYNSPGWIFAQNCDKCRGCSKPSSLHPILSNKIDLICK
jgi:hypothetical protein